MRWLAITALSVLLVLSAGAVQAGLRAPLVAAGARADTYIPNPDRSGIGIEGSALPCQFVFHPDGTRDHLFVHVTLRDAFDTPVQNCSTSATLDPGTSSFCSCCLAQQFGVTDGDGIVQFEYGKIGGYGLGDVQVTAHCIGALHIGTLPFHYTSTDLNASCDPDEAINVIDFAIFLGHFPLYDLWNDLDCSGAVDISDAALFSHCGGCNDGVPCP